VHLDGNRVRLIGRGSTCIDNRGEKVYPDEVEAVARSHPPPASPCSGCPTNSGARW